jgi:hypothetical protein
MQRVWRCVPKCGPSPVVLHATERLRGWTGLSVAREWLQLCALVDGAHRVPWLPFGYLGRIYRPRQILTV